MSLYKVTDQSILNQFQGQVPKAEDELKDTTKMLQAMKDLHLYPASFSIAPGQTKEFECHMKGTALVNPMNKPASGTQFGIDFSGTTTIPQAQIQMEDVLSKMNETSSYTVRVMGVIRDDNGTLVPSDIGNYDKGVLAITGTKAQIKANLEECMKYKSTPQNTTVGSTPIVRAMEDEFADFIQKMEFTPSKTVVVTGATKNGDVGTVTKEVNVLVGNKVQKQKQTEKCIALSSTGNEYIDAKLGLDGTTLKYFSLTKDVKEVVISTDATASDMSKGIQKEENAEKNWQARMESLAPLSKTFKIKFDMIIVGDGQTDLQKAIVKMKDEGAADEKGKPLGSVIFIGTYATTESKLSITPSNKVEVADNSKANEEITEVNSIQPSLVSKDFSVVISADRKAKVVGDMVGKKVSKIDYEVISTAEVIAPVAAPTTKNVHIMQDSSGSFKKFEATSDTAIGTIKDMFNITAATANFAPNEGPVDLDNIVQTVSDLARTKAIDGKPIGKNDVFILYTDGGNADFDQAFKNNIAVIKATGATIRLALYKPTRTGADGSEYITENGKEVKVAEKDLVELKNGRELYNIVNGTKFTKGNYYSIPYITSNNQQAIINGLASAIQPVTADQCEYSVSTAKYAKATITYADGTTAQAYLPLKYADKPDLLKDVGIGQVAPTQKPGNAFWTGG